MRKQGPRKEQWFARVTQEVRGRTPIQTQVFLTPEPLLRPNAAFCIQQRKALHMQNSYHLHLAEFKKIRSMHSWAELQNKMPTPLNTLSKISLLDSHEGYSIICQANTGGHYPLLPFLSQLHRRMKNLSPMVSPQYSSLTKHSHLNYLLGQNLLDFNHITPSPGQHLTPFLSSMSLLISTPWVPLALI